MAKKQAKSKKQNNPHDRFFKETFTQTGIAEDFFSQFLPKKLAEKLDYSTLERDTESYLTPELSEFYADVVWNCRLKNGRMTKIGLLLEHKSYKPDYVHVQLLRYIVGNWENLIKAKTPLVPIVSVILYHGSTAWKLENIVDYFGDVDDDILPYIPQFEVCLIDLNVYSDDFLLNLKKGFLISTLLSFKHHNDYLYIDAYFEKIINLVAHVSDSTEKSRFLSALWIYLSRISMLENKQLEEKMNNIDESIKSEIMSTYDNVVMFGYEKGIEKGIEKGLEKGKTETNKQVVFKALQKGLPIEMIAELVELPIEEVLKIIQSFDNA